MDDKRPANESHNEAERERIIQVLELINSIDLPPASLCSARPQDRARWQDIGFVDWC